MHSFKQARLSSGIYFSQITITPCGTETISFFCNQVILFLYLALKIQSGLHLGSHTVAFQKQWGIQRKGFNLNSHLLNTCIEHWLLCSLAHCPVLSMLMTALLLISTKSGSEPGWYPLRKAGCLCANANWSNTSFTVLISIRSLPAFSVYFLITHNCCHHLYIQGLTMNAFLTTFLHRLCLYGLLLFH